MNKRLFPFFFLLPVLLTACAFGYQARGSLSDVPGELRGKGYPGNSGGGRFVLGEPGGRLTCDGEALPPARSPNPGSCAGEGGAGVLRCSDGREMNFTWLAMSCRSLRGSGVDTKGNRLEFVVERR
ncbi:MAG: hypothetical protein WAV95_04960 [Azonexus sp.]